MLATIGGVDYFDSKNIGDFGFAIETFVLNAEDYSEEMDFYNIPIEDFTEDILFYTDARNNKILDNSLSIQKSLMAAESASLTIVDEELAYLFSKGQPIIIYSDNFNIAFSGFLHLPDIEYIAPSARRHILACVGNSYLAEKRLIRKVFIDATVEDMALWIYETYLRPEGVLLGQIDVTGETLDVKTFDLVSPSDALGDLAQIAGFIWKIDDRKRFYFVAFDSLDAPLDLDNLTDETSPLLDGLKVTRGSDTFYNVLYLRGGKAETIELTEYFVGNGELRSFDLRYPAKSVSSIQVNGIPQTVGIQGSGAAWTYSVDSKSIAQNSTEVAPPENSIIQVIYIGQYDLIIRVSSQGAIETVSAIEEGGSGLVETVIDAKDYTTEESLIAYGKSLLETNSKQSTLISYKTLCDSLDIGQMQSILLDFVNVDGKFLLVDVTYQREDSVDIWQITATDGPIENLWLKLFGKKPKPAASTEQSITVLEDFESTWSYYVYPSPFRADCDATKLFQYLELDIEGGFRVPITDLSIGNDEVVVTAEVLDSEALGDITKVSLWGSDGATISPGSGEKNWEGDFAITKSKYEAFKFTIRHIKAANWIPVTHLIPVHDMYWYTDDPGTWFEDGQVDKGWN